jgi:GT2 family glycosyltransferase
MDCIGSLTRQTLRPAETILALDRNEALVRFYKDQMPAYVKIVVSDGYGLSRARNTGIKNASGDVIAFIDDDAIADEQWLENLVVNYDDASVSGVGGLITPLWKGKQPIWFPEELFWIVGCSYKGLPEEKSVVRNLIGCNMSFRKSVFEKVGYFHEGMGRVGKKLSGHEDTEFSVRAARKIAEIKIVYDPSAKVYHRVPRSRTDLKYVARRSYAEGFSKAIFSSQEANAGKALNVEKNYLRNLLSASVTDRLFGNHDSGSILQIPVLLFSTAMVLIGYIVSKCMCTQEQSSS